LSLWCLPQLCLVRYKGSSDRRLLLWYWRFFDVHLKFFLFSDPLQYPSHTISGGHSSVACKCQTKNYPAKNTTSLQGQKRAEDDSKSILIAFGADSKVVGSGENREGECQNHVALNDRSQLQYVSVIRKAVARCQRGNHDNPRHRKEV